MSRVFSQRSLEGFVSIDHRESPGLSEGAAAEAARTSLAPFVGKGQVFKAATNTCSHCDRIVVKNPQRTRARGHCSSCDRFLCDDCYAAFYLTQKCLCFEKRADTFFNRAAMGGT